MQQQKQPFIVGVFDILDHAQTAITALQQSGVAQEHIQLIQPGHLPTNIFQNMLAQGASEQDTAYYRQELESGHPLILVTTTQHPHKVLDILTENGAANSGQNIQKKLLNNEEDTLTIQVREEQLQAEKQKVESGEVRIHKEVESEQKTLNVPVAKEEVFIERHSITPQLSDGPVGTDETINVPVMAEQVKTEKQTVVREEITPRKQIVKDTQQVSDTTRREDVHIERAYNEDIPLDNNPASE